MVKADTRVNIKWRLDGQLEVLGIEGRAGRGNQLNVALFFSSRITRAERPGP